LSERLNESIVTALEFDSDDVEVFSGW